MASASRKQPDVLHDKVGESLLGSESEENLSGYRQRIA
jgi:hypothetical protein